jgi:hypothetical protein
VPGKTAGDIEGEEVFPLMNRPRVPAATLAGAIGALLLFLVQWALGTTDASDRPVALSMVTHFLALEGVRALLIALVSSVLAGAALGALYGALFGTERLRVLSPLTGVLFGLVPFAIEWFAINPVLGLPARTHFASMMPTLLPWLVWGAFVGTALPPLVRWDTIQVPRVPRAASQT